MKTLEDGALRVIVFENLGPFGNNAYIIADADSKEAVIVDMPAGSAAVVAAGGRGHQGICRRSGAQRRRGVSSLG